MVDSAAGRKWSRARPKPVLSLRVASRCFWLTWLLSVASLIAGAGAVRADSTPSPAQAVQELNQWRGEVGVLPVSEDPEQSEGCRAHANYYRLNHQMGHYEEEGLPGYTQAGYRAAASSVLSFGGAKDGPFTWENAVYHRAGLLNPRLVTTGFWSEFELGCMGVFGTDDTRTTPALTAYTYPVDGQQGILTTFSCLEVPNPCQSVPGNDGSVPTGFISSVQFNGPWRRILGARVSAAQLTPDGGAPLLITVEGEGEGNGGFLDGGFDVIPQQPLAEGTWYTATASGLLDVDANGPEGETLAVPFTVRWRFRTVLIPRNPELKLMVADGRPRVFSKSPAPVRMTLRDGATKRLVLALHPAAAGGYTATAPGSRLHHVTWSVCASQPADASGTWEATPDPLCDSGGPLNLDVDALYASKYLVRLRIKAPEAAWGRRALVVMRPRDGSPPVRARIVLRRKSRLDLRGIPHGGAGLRVSVQPFHKHGIPQRVKTLTEVIHWVTAPPSGREGASRAISAMDDLGVAVRVADRQVYAHMWGGVKLPR